MSKTSRGEKERARHRYIGSESRSDFEVPARLLLTRHAFVLFRTADRDSLLPLERNFRQFVLRQHFPLRLHAERNMVGELSSASVGIKTVR